jgi:hypothetical protein
MSNDSVEISGKVLKSLIPHLPAPPTVGTGAGRQGLRSDYTDIRKNVEQFLRALRGFPF